LSSTQSNSLSQKQRNYLLTVISCKFNSFKCKTAFKYQQIKNNNEPDLNLHLALNHANELIRANAFNYILNELNGAASKSKKPIDAEFIRDELRFKLSQDPSPLVLKSILGFNVKLLDYLTLEELLLNNATDSSENKTSFDESILLKFFKMNRLDASSDETKSSDEVKEFYACDNAKWFECRNAITNFIFNDVYKIYAAKDDEHNQKDLFFNTYLIINSSLFELGEVKLIERFRNTQFYADMQTDVHSDSNNLAAGGKKSFYPNKSSISITKLPEKFTNGSNKNNTSASENGDDEYAFNELNELFEQFLQSAVKYLLSNSNKAGNNFIKKPNCFEKLNSILQGN
jgi:hypothetical protein